MSLRRCKLDYNELLFRERLKKIQTYGVSWFEVRYIRFSIVISRLRQCFPTNLIVWQSLQRHYHVSLTSSLGIPQGGKWQIHEAVQLRTAEKGSRKKGIGAGCEACTNVHAHIWFIIFFYELGIIMYEFNYYDIIWRIIFMNMYVNFTIHVKNWKESTMHAVDFTKGTLTLRFPKRNNFFSTLSDQISFYRTITFRFLLTEAKMAKWFVSELYTHKS